MSAKLERLALTVSPTAVFVLQYAETRYVKIPSLAKAAHLTAGCVAPQTAQAKPADLMVAGAVAGIAPGMKPAMKAGPVSPGN